MKRKIKVNRYRNKITLTGLNRLLNRVEFKIKEYKLTEEEKKNPVIQQAYANTKMTGRMFSHTFDKWIKKYNRVPTPKEFLAMQYTDFKKNIDRPNFAEKYGIHLPITPLLEKAIKNRILRGYKSLMIEIHTQLQLMDLYPSCKVISNDDLDMAGVDIVLRNTKNGKQVFIHVTSWTGLGAECLLEKGNRKLSFKQEENRCMNNIAPYMFFLIIAIIVITIFQFYLMKRVKLEQQNYYAINLLKKDIELLIENYEDNKI